MAIGKPYRFEIIQVVFREKILFFFKKTQIAYVFEKSFYFSRILVAINRWWKISNSEPPDIGHFHLASRRKKSHA